MRICYVGNFDRLSVSEPEIAACLEAFGHEVERLQEAHVSPQEVLEACQGADMLLVAKFRVGTPKEREDIMEQTKIPMVTWVFDLFVGL